MGGGHRRSQVGCDEVSVTFQGSCSDVRVRVSGVVRLIGGHGLGQEDTEGLNCKRDRGYWRPGTAERQGE